MDGTIETLQIVISLLPVFFLNIWVENICFLNSRKIYVLESAALLNSYIKWSWTEGALRTLQNIVSLACLGK